MNAERKDIIEMKPARTEEGELIYEKRSEASEPTGFWLVLNKIGGFLLGLAIFSILLAFFVYVILPVMLIIIIVVLLRKIYHSLIH